MKRPLVKAPFAWLMLIAVIILVADRLTKKWIAAHFALGESRFVTSFFSLSYVHNTGTAFGMLQNNNSMLIVAALIILGGLLYSARGFCERGGAWALLGVGLVLGGAVGNLVDRFTIGHVIDFLDFHFWPVFNVADSAISIGAFSLAIGLMRESKEGA
jgi:signal peptidase II